jgi:hypothetical protein
VATIAAPTFAQTNQSKANQPKANPKTRVIRRKFSKNDLFNTFSDLDRGLTALDRQMQALKASMDVPPASATNTANTKTKPTSAPIGRPWRPVARTMRPTALTLERDAEKIRLLYRTRERRLHKRPFSRLSADARRIRRQLAVAGAARTRSWEKIAQARLSKAILSFVSHFQGVSGGYGALRCEPGEQSCCEPKRSTPKSPYDGCRWVCVKSVAACRSGFPGPTIRPNFQHTGSGLP